MVCRNFYEIIKNTRTNITKGYNRINELFESTDSGLSVCEMMKTDLSTAAKISTNAMAKFGKNEDVRVGVLVKICET